MTIQTERLTLRPLYTADLETTHRYASDVENTRYMMFLPNESQEETLDFLREAQEEWGKERPDFYEFAVCLNGAHIGAVSAYRQEDGTTAELGWIFDKRYWGRGYAAEAARAMMQACVRELGFTRFIAHCDSENAGSYRVMEKLGMRRAGCQPGRKNRSSDEERSEYLYELNGAPPEAKP